MPAGGAVQSGWIASPSSLQLLFRDYADGTVCFDPATTETRLLSPLTRFLLELLADAGQTIVSSAYLVQQVLAVDESASDAEAVAGAVHAALAELARAGLAHPSEAT